MVKQSVNLIIKKDEDSPKVKKFKKILPIVAGVFFFVLIISSIVIFQYMSSLTAELNGLKRDVSIYEQRITAQGHNEDLYLTSQKVLTSIEKILLNKKSFSPLLSEVVNLPTSGITIPGASADKMGNLSFNLIASSSSKLDEFVTVLREKETKSKLFSQIFAGGIVRSVKGVYSASITLKVDKLLLQ